jgi:hypothetical protein
MSGIWKVLTIAASCVVAVGLGAVGVDFATIGRFELISRNFGVILVAILAGATALLVALIGWATVLGKVGRIRIAFFAFLLSFGVILIGFLLAGTNVHGLFFLFVLSMSPIILAGFVAAIMAASTRNA